MNRYNAITAVFLCIVLFSLGYLTIGKVNTNTAQGIALVASLSAIVISLRRKLFPDEIPPTDVSVPAVTVDTAKDEKDKETPKP